MNNFKALRIICFAIILNFLIPLSAGAWSGGIGKYLNHHGRLAERALRCIAYQGYLLPSPSEQKRCQTPTDAYILYEVLHNGSAEPDKPKESGGDGLSSPKHSYNPDYPSNKTEWDPKIREALGLSPNAIINGGDALNAIKEEVVKAKETLSKLKCDSSFQAYKDIWRQFGRLSHYPADLAVPLHVYSLGIDNEYHEGDVNSTGAWYRGLWDRGLIGHAWHGALELDMGNVTNFETLSCSQLAPIEVARSARDAMKGYSSNKTNKTGYEGLLKDFQDFQDFQLPNEIFFNNIGPQQAQDALGGITKVWIDALTGYTPPSGCEQPPAGSCDEGGDGANKKSYPGGAHPDDTFSVASSSMSSSSGEILEQAWDRLAVKKNRKSLIWFWMQSYLNGEYRLGNIDEAGYRSRAQSYDLTSEVAWELFYNDYITAPDVAILGRGFALSLTDLLQDKYYEPVRRFTISDFGPDALRDYPVFAIASGGLMGLEKSEVFKSSLDQYVKAGGTLVVFAQQYGYEFKMLPVPQESDGTYKPVTGYGWSEDQECFTNAVYVDTPHQMLSSISRTTPTLSVDGYFTGFPTNATILLRRTANGQPAMIMYEHGLGKVIVTSMYSDFAMSQNQASLEELALVRDMVAWAKKPATLPEIRPGETVSVPVTIINNSPADAASAKLFVYAPDRTTLLLEQTVSATIPVGSSSQLITHYASPITASLGIYHIDYELYDASGIIIQPQAETDSGRFVVSNPPSTGYIKKDINFAVNSDAEHYFLGNEARFTVTIWNNSNIARTIRTDYLTYHLGIENTSKTITVPAKSSASFQVIVPQMPSEGWFVARFYAENGAKLGEQWKGVWLDTPSVDTTVALDSATYDKNQPVTMTIGLTNTSVVAAPWTANIRTTVQGSSGSVLYEKSSNATLSLNDSAVLTQAFTLPSNAAVGTYSVSVAVYAGQKLVSSKSSFFTVPQSNIETAPVIPSALTVGPNAISFALHNSGKLSVQYGNFMVALSDPAGIRVYSSEQSFALASNESRILDFQLVVPPLKEGRYTLLYNQSDESREGSEVVITLPNKRSMVVWSDKYAYKIGETAVVSMTIANDGRFRQEGLLEVASPLLGFSDTKPVIVEPGKQITELYQIPVPFLEIEGVDISARFSDISGVILLSAMHVYVAPFSIEQNIAFDKPSYRVRETLGLTYSATNNGNIAFPFSAPLTISIPSIDYQYQAQLQTVPGLQNELALTAALPETLPAGQHKITATIMLPTGKTISKDFTFTVPESSLKLAYGGPLTITPEDIGQLTVENSGGVDTSYSASEINLIDSKGVLLFSGDGAGPLPAGESNILSTFQLPSQTMTGPVYLTVHATDDNTGREAAVYKSLNVTGLAAGLEAHTSKDIYLKTEPVTGLLSVLTESRTIENGRLNLKVRGADVIEKFGTFIPRGYWPFDYLREVAAAGDNTVYVANSNTIFMYDRQGNFVKNLQMVINNKTFYPDSIAVGPDDFLYMIDDSSDSILKYDYNGNYISKWDGNPYYYGSQSRRLAIGSDGAVIVVDPNYNQLRKYDSGGSLLFAVDLHGYPYPGPTYGYGHGMTLAPDGSLYIAHSGRHTVQKYDLDGNFLLEWGGYCSTDVNGDLLPELPCTGQLNKPQSIVLTVNGTLAVADTGNNRIVEFDLSGNQLSSLGSYGVENGQLNSPMSISTDTAGRIYIADYSSRLQIIDAMGNFIDVWGTQGYGNGQFQYPRSAAVDESGSIYITDYYNDRIQKFDNAGRFVSTWGAHGFGDGEFYHPSGIAISRDGYLYVYDITDRIQKFDLSGNFLLSWGQNGTADERLNDPTGISVSADGYVFVAESYNSYVKKFDSSGKFIMKWGGYGYADGQFCSPWGIAAHDGYVYVADGCGDNIQKFDANGNFVLKWGSSGSGNGQFGGFLPGMAVGLDGSVYVIDTYNNRLQQFDAQGNFKGSWGSWGVEPGLFSRPEGVTIDRNGVVYVIDTGNNRIQRLTKAAGEITTLFETTIAIDQAANTRHDISSVLGTFANTGKLYLLTELQNNLGQTLATAEYPFYIVGGTTALSITTDKKLYRSGDTVAVSGVITNLSAAAVSSVDLAITADNNSAYALTVDIAANGNYPFSFTLPALTEGLHSISGKVLQNGTELVNSVHQYEIARPAVVASVNSPYVAGSEPVDIIVELRNTGKLNAEIQLNVSSPDFADSAAITIPPGEIRQLQYSPQITTDTTFAFTFSGDLIQRIEQTIIFGEKADLFVTTQPVYKEGAVSIPYEVYNVGLIEAVLPVSFTLLKNGAEIAQNSLSYLLPVDGQGLSVLNYTLAVGTYVLRYATNGSVSEIGFEVVKPGQGMLTLPDSGIYPEGTVEIPYTLTNTGIFDAVYNIRAGVGSISVMRSVFVAAGSAYSDTARFELAAGEYAVNAEILSYPSTPANSTLSVLKQKLVGLEASIATSQGTIPVVVQVANQGYGGISGSVRLSVQNSHNETVWSSEHQVIQLQSLAAQSISFIINPAAMIPGVYELRTEFLEGGNVVLAQTIQALPVSGAVIGISQVPSYRTFNAGEEAVFTFKVKNTGNQGGTAEFAFKAYDLSNMKRREWLAPGEEREISFAFITPTDLEAKDYFADFELKSGDSQLSIAKGQVKYHLAGINLSINSFLDKQTYTVGDTVHLTLTVSEQQSAVNRNLFARVNYAGFEDQQTFTLNGNTTLTFDIPLSQITGKKLFYGIYHESGRSIHLNSLYVHKTGDIITITTNKQVYNPGETVSVAISSQQSAVSGTMTLTAPGYSETFAFSGTTSKSFGLPQTMTAGTYSISADLSSADGNSYSESHAIDIAGIQVKVLECKNNKAKYAASDTITTELTISSNSTMPAVLKTWIIDPEGKYTAAGEAAINLSSSDPLLVTHNASLVTAVSGIHRLVYGIYSGDLLLVSGSEAFDVGDAVLLGLKTDKTDYLTNTESVKATATIYGSLLANMELQLDGIAIKNESVVLDGFSTLEMDLGSVTPGSHVLKGILTAGGLKSTKETSFVYGSSLPDLTAGLGVQNAVPDQNNALQITATVANQGRTASAATTLALYDNDSLIETKQVNALNSGESQEITFVWNVLGKTGHRTLKAVVDPDNLVIEFNEVNNTALMNLEIPDLSLVTGTDKDIYKINQNVQISSTIRNLSSEKTFSGLTLITTAKDPAGNDVYINAAVLTDIQPLGTKSDTATWNTTALNTEGRYTISQQLISGTQVLAQSAKTVTVIKASDFSMSTVSDHLSVRQGEQATYTVNLSPLNGWVSPIILSLTGLPAGASVSFNPGNLVPPGQALIVITTNNTTPAGSYTLTLTADGTDNGDHMTHTLSLTLDISDAIPPTGSLMINNNDAFTKTATVALTLHATDESGVTKMCISNSTTCTAWENYAASRSWSLPSGDGTKILSVWYQDSVGNINALPYTATITLDTTAPSLTVSTLADGRWTNNELLNISGEATDQSGIRELTINNVAVTVNPDGTFGCPVLLADGPNTIITKATDLAGNETSDTRTVNLDRSSPNVTILTPADNMKTNQPTVNVTGTVSEAAAVTIKVDDSAPLAALMNGNSFSLMLTPHYGINTIEATAIDIAGNSTTAKRTVTFDDVKPMLSVTEPAQDIKTNQANMTIEGEVQDLTSIAVTLTMDGHTYSPAVSNGRFEQPVVFSEQMTYQINVEAVDEAGNASSVQRHVLYDTTGPVVTLNPVTSPTGLTSQILAGTMEIGATVSVTCPTATVSAVSYPTATTWTVTLADMQEGNNEIAVTAMDDLGNVGVPVLATIVVSAGNAITNVSPARLWIGLKNSDDQGTQFDLRAELYINGLLVSSGETLCITGVTRNASLAKEVALPFAPISDGAYSSGDVISLRILTRIGSTPDGLKCSGPGGSHNNAVGLRMYYDSADRPSRFGAEIVPSPMQDLFLHSTGTNYFLNNVAPSGTAKYKDSAGISYNNGNPWKEIGTWTMVMQ